MKHSLLFIVSTLFTTLALSTQANAVSIAGSWQCEIRFNFPQADGFLQDTKANLVIQKNQKEYERTGVIRISFKDLPSLFVEAHTYEKGTVKFANNQLIISPLIAEVKVVKSGPMDKNLLKSQLLPTLSKQATWNVTQLTQYELAMNVNGEPVTDRCKKG